MTQIKRMQIEWGDMSENHLDSTNYYLDIKVRVVIVLNLTRRITFITFIYFLSELYTANFIYILGLQSFIFT